MQNTAFSTNKTLNLNGRLIDLHEPCVMAILNVTPDSFFDGGKFSHENEILKRAEQIVQEGATFIDIGGYSSRPGAKDIPATEELQRIIPSIRSIAKHFPELVISVDTFRGEVAKAAIQEGACLINDISAGSLDPSMLNVITSSNVPYVLMHMKGSPQTMMEHAVYNNVVSEVLEFFHQKVHLFQQMGIKDIIIDPGFGFAKTREHNLELLNQLEVFRCVERPVMAGLSRKSMVWKTLNILPNEALNGTTVLNTIALLKGIDILRVHDVREAVQAITLVKALTKK